MTPNPSRQYCGVPPGPKESCSEIIELRMDFHSIAKFFKPLFSFFSDKHGLDAIEQGYTWVKKAFRTLGKLWRRMIVGQYRCMYLEVPDWESRVVSRCTIRAVCSLMSTKAEAPFRFDGAVLVFSTLCS